MTEALIERLSTLRDVRVVSRTSVMQFKQSRKPVPEIARELNVDAVVEGAVLRSAERVRISVRLVRGATDEKVWSNVYDRNISDVLSLQSELAMAITRQIEGRLAGRLTAFPATSRSVAPEVYESYLKGRFQLNNRNRDAVEESIKHFESAIAGDPGFAPAFSALGIRVHRARDRLYRRISCFRFMAEGGRCCAEGPGIGPCLVRRTHRPRTRRWSETGNGTRQRRNSGARSIWIQTIRWPLTTSAACS